MARNKPPSFDLYPDDLIAGTMHLHPICMGIYMRMLCFQWSHGAVPSDIDQLARITGASQKELEKYLDFVIKKFTKQDDGTLKNERLEREREKKLKVREKRKFAANSRWSQSDVDIHAVSKSDANASPHAHANGMLPIRKMDSACTEHVALPDFFESFWSEYPTKKGKDPARAAYKKAIARLSKTMAPEMAHEKLRIAAIDYANYLKSQPNPPKAKYAQGWLNDSRYEDDLTETINRLVDVDPRGNAMIVSQLIGRGVFDAN